MKVAKLGDVCKLVGGGTPSKANSDFYLGEIPWATVRDLRSRWLEDTEHRINALAVQESSTNVIPAGNVVLASRVGLGKVVQLKRDTAINQDLRALIPKNTSQIDSDYLFYWTLSVSPDIIAAGKGATVQGVKLPFLENLEIPLPAQEKQREIVEKLDGAFAEIERFESNTVVEIGRTRGLFQSFIDDQMWRASKGAAIGRLDEYCQKIQDGSHYSPKIQLLEPKVGWYPYLTSKNIRNNFIDFNGVTYVNSKFHKEIFQRCNPEFGDVLLTKDGVNTGNVTINTLTEPFSLLSSVCILKPDRARLDPAYLKFFIQSSLGYRAILGDMTGAAIKRIILRTIKGTRIPVPEIETQREIGVLLESRLADLNLYVENLNKRLSSLRNLRSSLLSEAFHKSLKGVSI